MKNLFILTGLFIISLNGISQSNLVIFAEDGDLFYAHINGVRQNDKPESNVKVTGLTSSAASLRVEFADKALPQLKQSMQMQPNMEYAVRIKRDMKKQLKLRYFGETPISKDPTPGVTSVPYHSTENTSPYNTATTTDVNTTPVTNGNTSVTSTTTTRTGGTPENAGVNINMTGTGINMNVTGMDPNTMNTTTSTTVTTSTSSTGSYQEATTPQTSYNNNNTTTTTTIKGGCGAAMPASDFSKLKKTVESKPFSDTKMSTAKVATKNGCLSTNQVKEICKLFSMDDDKLAYAKYAFDYCVDKGNYYQVSEVFTFSSTTDDFNKFLEQ